MEEDQKQEVHQFVFQITVDTETGHPSITTNMPTDMAVAYVELAKQQLFVQFYQAVNQLRAEAAAKKPQIAVARMVPNLKR